MRFEVQKNYYKNEGLFCGGENVSMRTVNHPKRGERKINMYEINKKFFADFFKRVQQAADLMLTNVITDPHQLLVALALSDFSVIAEILSVTTEHEACHIVAHQALDIGCNPSVRRNLAKCNYFTEVLCGLLELAEKDPVVGSRLVPVFDEAVSVHKDLRISKALKRKLKEFTEMKLEADGFAIGRRGADGKIRVKTAVWVNKKMEAELAQSDVEPRKDKGEEIPISSRGNFTLFRTAKSN